MSPRPIPNCLTIAGVDPSGGAGLLADVKAMSARGVYATGVVTALTAQNTRGVSGVMAIPPDFIRAQLDTLFADVAIAAVKIGMLAEAEVIAAVADRLRRYRPRWIVLDPVMVAKSGDRLLAAAALSALRQELLPLAHVITPNLPEASDLLGRTVSRREQMPEAAAELRALSGGHAAVLLKGGHLVGDQAPDYLLDEAGGVWLEGRRTATGNTHGTGCTLSSALAAELALSDDLRGAARRAKDYIGAAIAGADRLRVGGGHGPTHHFVELWPESR